jgi:hypothetical protein
MGKSEVASTLLSKAKAFWGWFIKKSPAFIVATSLTVVGVFGLGVGGTLAATGVIPNPFSSQVPEEVEVSVGETDRQVSEEEYWTEEFQETRPPSSYSDSSAEWLPGSSWTPFGQPGTISYRWSTTDLHTRVFGPCTSGVMVHTSPPNYGYLSDPVAGIQGIGWSAGIGAEPSEPGQKNCHSTLVSNSAGYLKCFNFSEVWVNIVGPSPQAGFYKIPIPEGIAKVDCPSGSENNDPSKFLSSQVYEQLKDFPEAVVTPPKLNGGPPTIEWGRYVAATPTPTPSTTPTPETSPTPTPTPSTTPTPETSPTPTTEPSPTPTPETSPTPTTEPSPTPTSP